MSIRTHTSRALCPAQACANMCAVVEVPHARRVVVRSGDNVLAVCSHADGLHPVRVPLERAHLRAFGDGPHARAVSSAEQNVVHIAFRKV
eukprot:6210514-Pleurochrysis_carterae.AAC.1